MARTSVNDHRRHMRNRRTVRNPISDSSSLSISDSSSSTGSPGTLPPPPGSEPRPVPPPPDFELMTRARAQQQRESGLPVMVYQIQEDEPMVIPPHSSESDKDYAPSTSKSSDSEDFSDPPPTAQQAEYLHAAISKSDSSERGFWKQHRDALLEQAEGLEQQAEYLYERAQSLREMAADLERGGPVNSSSQDS